ncbi:MAG: ATP-binding protein, partial [Isosphaeraceae bacterium]
MLNSLHLEGIGFGALEKEQDRKARLFREKVEEIEMESWRQAGCPEGGPVQFRAVACDQLKQALEGEGGRLMANMTDAQLSALLIELTSLPDETEWVEWKHDDTSKEIGPYIAEYLSALANSAALHSKETAYLVWGIEDGTRNVVGTKFKPRKAKQGNEELENWLMRSL